jgi:hypothetical protein
MGWKGIEEGNGEERGWRLGAMQSRRWRLKNMGKVKLIREV